MRRIPSVCVAGVALCAGPLAGEVPPDATARADRAPSPDAALLARVVEAAGDPEALAALRGFRARGRILPLVDGPTATTRVAVDLRGSLREDVRDAAGLSSQRLVGPLAWRGGRKLEPATGTAADEIRRRHGELTAPFDPARAAPGSLEDGGETPEGWRRLVRREPGGGGAAWDVDAANGRVRRFARIGADSTATRRDETEFDDYRLVEGIAWPFRATTYVDGRPVLETVWERFEPAQDLSPDEFLPAGGAGGL
jgi:hypothetical protein